MQLKLTPLLSHTGIRAYSTERGLTPADDSSLPYNGFSVCHYTGDDPVRIQACRHMLATRLGVDEKAIVIPRQTHSTNVAVITPDNIGADFNNVDALVTTMRGVVIGVNTADCVPVIMADPHARVIGVAHAGWRGALGGVATNTLLTMMDAGANPSDIIVEFGPSICADCFEVGPEVASQFPAESVVTRPDWERPHVDLHRYITYTLAARGVARENITPFNPSLCTRHHPDIYYSARALGVNSGRVYTFAYLE
ncbi:MAG: polyphenol oxidase family protein [Muribaculaceae bacterium]|nr:polyphenol oxidase family protein [Muribaculaceae bacterium]